MTAFDAWTARAAEDAGVDMIVAWGADFESTKYVVGEVRRAVDEARGPRAQGVRRRAQ